MYLINAIYFKGTWLYQFDSSATKPDDFYISPTTPMKCMMMNQKDTLNYFASEDFQAAELPYENGDFSMIIILPAPNTNLNTLIGQLNENYWDQLLTNTTRKEVNLWLPKSKIEYFASLKKF